MPPTVLIFFVYELKLIITNTRGAWVAHSVKCQTLAQDMISWFVGSSPAWVSVLTAQSLDPVSDSVCVCVCLSLSALPPAPISPRVSLCLSKINIEKTFFI